MENQSQITDEQQQKQFCQIQEYHEYRLHIQSKYSIIVKYNSRSFPLTKLKMLRLKNQEVELSLHILKNRMHILNHQRQISHLLSYDTSPQLSIVIAEETQTQRCVYLEAEYVSNPNFIQFYHKFYSRSIIKDGVNFRLLCDVIKKSIDYPIAHYQLIPTYSNIFINYSNLQLSFNHLSLAGLSLIIFQQKISRKEFQQIYPFLYNAIFQKEKSVRINFFMYQRLLALLILSMLVQKPILYEQNQKFADMVGFEQASQYIRQLSGKFRKLLQCKFVKNQIDKSQKLSGIKVYAFLYQTLVDEKQLSLGEIVQIIERRNNQNENKELITLDKHLRQIAKQIWTKIDEYTRMQLWKNGIISSQSTENKLKQIDNEIFLLYYFKIDPKVIYKYGNLSRFLQKSIYSQYNHNILCKMLSQINQQTKKGLQIPLQSLINKDNSNKQSQTQLYILSLSKLFGVLSQHKIIYNQKSKIIESQERRSIRLLMKSMHLQ